MASFIIVKKKKKHGQVRDLYTDTFPILLSSYGILFLFYPRSRTECDRCNFYPSVCLIQDLARSNDKITPPNTPFRNLYDLKTHWSVLIIPPKFTEKQVAHTQRSEEPPVLAAGVSVLKRLLDGLLGVLTLGNLLEGLGGNGALEALELESVTGGHQVVVVDNLDERLDAAALLDSLLPHTTGDLQWVALNTSDDGVGEGLGLGTGVVRLDNDDL